MRPCSQNLVVSRHQSKKATRPEARAAQVWLCRPLKGTWFPLLSFPGTPVPGSGFFRPFRDWFADGFSTFEETRTNGVDTNEMRWHGGGISLGATPFFPCFLHSG